MKGKSMRNNNGAITILGGMGPEASAKMLEVIVAMASKEFGVKIGENFPEIIVDSIPVPDFISDMKKIKSAKAILSKRVLDFDKLNVSYVVLACNTAHLLFPELSSISKAEFVSMIDAVCDAVFTKGLRKVGILATPSTLSAGLYQKALTERCIEYILPKQNEISRIEAIIRSVIAGETKRSDSVTLTNIANNLVSKGAEGIILGCTELPLIFPKDFSVCVFDSIEITSRFLLTNYYDAGGANG